MTLKKLLTQYRDVMWRNAIHSAATDHNMAVIYHTRADTLNDVIRIIEKLSPEHIDLYEMSNSQLKYGEWPGNKRAP